MDKSEMSFHSLPTEGLFSGESETHSLLRSFDWSTNPLGPVDTWPQSLRTAVSICLDSLHPMLIMWGPDYIQVYNDSFRPILGTTKHPKALGQRAIECWPEIWNVIGPMFEQVMTQGKAIWSEDLLFLLDRNGYLEETYFTFSYSPIRQETGQVGGILVTCVETTQRHLGVRRLNTLRRLAERTAEAKTVQAACEIAAGTLEPTDTPFALIYLLDEKGQAAQLAATARLEPATPASPRVISLADEQDALLWPIAGAVENNRPEQVEELDRRFGPLPGGPWPESPDIALVLPIAAQGQARPTGALIVGTSPRLPLDEDYISFYQLVVGQVGTAIANARAHEAEQERVEALAELDRAKSVFFGNVSHEFRTPLTLLLGPLEDLLSNSAEGLSGPQREQLDLAHRNALRLVKLVNSLLDFTRIEAGRMEAAYEPTDLAGLTVDLASVFRSAIERAGLRLVVDCPPLSEPVYVDREMWEKIVLNLLTNAYKFTREGEIAITLIQQDQAVELQVRDTGTGIPPEELPHIFERFHRVHGASARTMEGTGIGLALVQELVKLHGGSVRVTSVPGEGSLFIVRIPTGAEHLPHEPINTARPLTSTALDAAPFVEEALRWLPGSGDGAALEQSLQDLAASTVQERGTQGRDVPSILVADDNADMRDYMSRLLSRKYRVQAVSSGSAALAAAEKQAPDLVVADVMMPGLDGLELVKRLRATVSARYVPIILLSARAGEEARAEGLEAGADDYLVKPFSARELLARVGSCLELAWVRAESNRQITSTLESITDSFIGLDSQWRFTFLNRAAGRAFELLGKNPEALIGKSIWEELPELVGTTAEEHYRRAMSEHRPVAFEYYYPRINTWFDIHAYPSPDGLSIYFQDVTVRKQAEASLARLAAIVESSDDAIVSKNLDGIIQSWNPGAERIFGYPAQEVLGKPISIIYPEDHIDEFPRIMQRLRMGERIEHYETVRQRKGGQLINVSVSISPIKDATGRVIAAAKIARDITERQHAEEAQRFLAEATELLASSLDYETTLKSLARLAVPRLADWCVVDMLDDEGRLHDLEVAHQDPARVQLGWELRKRYPLEMDARTGPPYVVRTGKSELLPEITDEMLAAAARTPDDLTLFRSIGLSSAMTVPLIARGRMLGVIELIYAESGRRFSPADLAFAQELARRAALAVDNARLYREVQEAVRVRDQFLSIASHELRTPLTSIYGYTQLLDRLLAKSAPASDSQPGTAIVDRNRTAVYLHKLERASERLTRLIAELLDVSRLRENRLSLERERMDLAILVSSVVDTLRQQQEVGTSSNRVSFQLELPGEGVVCGEWDSSRLEQVVQNLLGNAVKYSLGGGSVEVRLAVEAGTAAAEGQEPRTGRGGLSAHLIIQDHGIGIPSEQQDQLFQPFFRAANATAGHFGGLGLGLAICKGIIQAHGGRIWVESAGLSGSTAFHVLLPGVESAGDEPATVARAGDIADVRGI